MCQILNKITRNLPRNQTQRKDASKLYNKALFRIGVKAAEDLWHVDITDGKGVGRCSGCEGTKENICIKKLLLLNRPITILARHINTGALSDSDLHLERPNPATLCIFIHYQQPLLNTSCPLAQVDNLLRVTIVFMLFFHKPGLKFVKLHHCLTMCQSKGNCQMEQLSPNLAPGNEITHRPQSYVKSFKKKYIGRE